MKKEKQHLRNNQKKIMVSDHDLKIVGGDAKMNEILRNARDKAVAELCGCEVCQLSKTNC